MKDLRLAHRTAYPLSLGVALAGGLDPEQMADGITADGLRGTTANETAGDVEIAGAVDPGLSTRSLPFLRVGE
jgi:hypothetical protein